MNEQTKNILVHEKDPSSYVDDSLEPSERTPHEIQRMKRVKNISELNQSFEEMDTKKKPEPVGQLSEGWSKNPIINKKIRYVTDMIKIHY
jgi:hypothetical protein